VRGDEWFWAISALQYTLVFLLRCPALWEGSFTYAWHDADADLLAARRS
jgi:hypothetical protein